MNFSALIVPVLAGYLFLVTSWPTRYSTVRRSGYHLFFNSALVGALLLVVARLITNSYGSPCSPLQAWWREFGNFPYSGTLALALGLALGVAGLVNGFILLFSDRSRWAKKAAKKYGNLIDWLMADALGTGSLLEFTTKSGKSYVGFPQRSDLSVGDSSEIALIPVLSGYREAESRKLEFTTDYWRVYLAMEDEGGPLPHLESDDFLLIVPRGELISARRFDPHAYDYFNTNDESDVEED